MRRATVVDVPPELVNFASLKRLVDRVNGDIEIGMKVASLEVDQSDDDELRLQLIVHFEDD